MTVEETRILGLMIVHPDVHPDGRGFFIKTYHEPTWRASGLRIDWVEEFHTVSHKSVLRGFHFQTPPMEQAKVISCEFGSVFDAVLDIRRGSPTYGSAYCQVLDASNPLLMYVPVGMAHGYLVLSEGTVVSYRTTSVFSAENDTGILWSSAGIAWPSDNPTISDRDAGFPSLDQFQSPFGGASQHE
ncbi:MAG TPA: dTDP-4-dehydrorhamnose 3,5-epimerase family protein [Candidatus Cryosericum sp.]